MVAHCHLDLNPGFHGRKPSALPLSYAAIPVLSQSSPLCGLSGTSAPVYHCVGVLEVFR